MFNYEKTTYEATSQDDENYYWVMMNKLFNIYSPFEVSDEDFPKKDKIGGVVLKLIGAGAVYFKVQREKPNHKEIKTVDEICKYLQKKHGQYVVAFIICEPHIEIFDIDNSFSKYSTYVSSRKSDGDEILKKLTKKIKSKRNLTSEEHILRVFLPFMSRKNDEEFQKKYDEFVALFNEDCHEIPSFDDLKKTNFETGNIFGEDENLNF